MCYWQRSWLCQQVPMDNGGGEGPRTTVTSLGCGISTMVAAVMDTSGKMNPWDGMWLLCPMYTTSTQAAVGKHGWIGRGWNGVGKCNSRIWVLCCGVC